MYQAGETIMKYCIGCTHLDLTPRYPGAMGSTWTGIYGDEEAAMFCYKGYWRNEMDARANLETFRQCMEKAQTCADFEERTV
jgi:hypothetical protein